MLLVLLSLARAEADGVRPDRMKMVACGAKVGLQEHAALRDVMVVMVVRHGAAAGTKDIMCLGGGMGGERERQPNWMRQSTAKRLKQDDGNEGW